MAKSGGRTPVSLYELAHLHATAHGLRRADRLAAFEAYGAAGSDTEKVAP